MKSIESICKKYNIKNYTINDDGTVDVDGNVNLLGFDLTELPLNFNKVSGSFWIDDNKLTTLKGCPESVGRDFDCSKNNLTTLEFGPKKVGDSYICYKNFLTDLKGSSESCIMFNCHKNSLTSLKSDLKSITSMFRFESNKIMDFYDFDPSILKQGVIFIDSENPISSLTLGFNQSDFIYWFNVVKPVKGNKVSLKKLKYIYHNLGRRKAIDKVEIEFIKRFYKIVD